MKDSGNDLIAIRGNSFRGLQVKTTANGGLHWQNLPLNYHILALVSLEGEGEDIFLDNSKVYLVPKEEVVNIQANDESLEPFIIYQNLIDHLFGNG